MITFKGSHIFVFGIIANLKKALCFTTNIQ